MRAAFAALAFVLVTASASAQTRPYIDHRTYPADFPTLQPGDPVAGRPGTIWRHDGLGWYWELAAGNLPTDAACPDRTTWNPYTAPDAEILACFPRPLLPFEAADGTRYGYVVGEVYGPVLYPTGERIIVLSVVPDVNSTRRIVSFKWLRGPQTGELGIFYEDQKRFVPVRAGER
jgi:hypothetical protein